MAGRVEMPESTVQELTRWYSEDLIRSTPLFKSSLFGRLFGLFGQAAVTINKSVHLTGKPPRDLTSHSGIVLLGHELYHVVQQQEMGWWNFLLRYLWHWRPWHVTQGWKHPLEEPPMLGRMRLAVLYLPDRATDHAARDKADTQIAEGPNR